MGNGAMELAALSDGASSTDGTAPLALPPMPKAERTEQAREERRGILLVSALIIFFTALTTVIALTRPSSAVSWTFAAAIYTEAVLAILCLRHVLHSGAGVIRHSAETCFPVPAEVAARIRAGDSLAGLPNPRQGDRSYCVRCCVWRPLHAHHCSTVSGAGHCQTCRPALTPLICRTALTPRCRYRPSAQCQRCVSEFDHHCNVLGRCIAGSASGCRGNMPSFVGLIGLGLLAASTAIFDVAVSFPPHGWWALLAFAWCGVGGCIQCSVRCCDLRSRYRWCLYRLRCCCPKAAQPQGPPARDFTAADAQRVFTSMENRLLPIALAVPVAAPPPAAPPGQGDPGSGEDAV